MNNMQILKEKLYKTNASLVVYKNEVCKEYYKPGIRDIINILTESKKGLKGATIADKVIGKVAGSILILAGVKEIYADTISKLVMPILEENNIKYEYREAVDFIQNKDKTAMCPMENKFKDEEDLTKIYDEFIK